MRQGLISELMDDLNRMLTRNWHQLASVVDESQRSVHRIAGLADERLGADVQRIGESMATAIGAAGDAVAEAIDAEIRALHRLLMDDHKAAMDRIRAEALARYATSPPLRSQDQVLDGLSQEAQEMVRRVLEDMPTRTTLIGPDELTAMLHALQQEVGDDVMTVNPIGHSSEGRLLEEFVIHGGPQQLVVIAGVHANELIGDNTMAYLADKLAKDAELREELGATWRFICIDPDSMALNTWINGPYTRNRDDFRPAGWEQPTMVFPCQHVTPDGRVMNASSQLPEMLALKSVIDAHRDDLVLIFELHNSEIGTFPLVSKAFHDLPAGLRDVIRGDLPLVASQWGIPVLLRSQEVVDARPTLRPEINDIEAETWEHGVPLAGYVGSDVVVFQPEFPLFAMPADGDHTPTDESFADVLIGQYVPAMREIHDFLAPALADLAPFLKPTRHLSRAQDFAAGAGAMADAAENVAASPVAQRPVLVSEKRHLLNYAHGQTPRRSIMFTRRALEEGMGPNPPRSVLAFHAAVMEREIEWGRRAEEVTGPPTPIDSVSAAQAASVLVMARHLLRRR